MDPMDPDILDPERAHFGGGGICVTCWLRENAPEPPAPGELALAIARLGSWVWAELTLGPRILEIRGVELGGNREEDIAAVLSMLERMGIWAAEELRIIVGPDVPDLPGLSRPGFHIQRGGEIMSPKSLSALGIDPGFGNFKIAAPDGSRAILQASYAVVPRPVFHGDDLLGERRGARPAFHEVRLEDRTVLVGQIAHLVPPIQRLDLRRFEGGPDMEALLLASLYRLGCREAEIEQAVLGLPVALLEDKQIGRPIVEAARAWIQGEHRGVVDRREVRVRISRVTIIPQPAGAFYLHTLEYHEGRIVPAGDARGKVGVVDVGRNTVDIIVFRDGQADIRRTVGEQLGVWRAADQVARILGITLEEAEQMILEQPDHQVVREALEQLGGMIAAEILRAAAWRDLADLRWILVGGGMMFPPIRETIRQRISGAGIIMPRDPVAANAIGMARAALLLLQKKEEKT